MPTDPQSVSVCAPVLRGHRQGLLSGSILVAIEELAGLPSELASTTQSLSRDGATQLAYRSL